MRKSSGVTIFIVSLAKWMVSVRVTSLQVPSVSFTYTAGRGLGPPPRPFLGKKRMGATV